MAKGKGKGGGKETITPPSAKMATKASAGLRAGNPVAARVMADISVASREGVKRPKGKK